MNIAAIIVAGGSGSRMGAQVPKQFLVLAGLPIFIRTLQTFRTALPDAQLVLVMPGAHLQEAKELMVAYGVNATVVEGGNTRFASVCNGLRAIGAADLVLVHDAVRCLLSPALIHRCVALAQEKGNALPVVDCVDTPRLRLPHGGNQALERKRLALAQTPQTFRFDQLKQVMLNATYTDQFTDEATVMELHGHAIHLVDGEEWNLKITRPQDLVLAEWWLAQGLVPPQGLVP